MWSNKECRVKMLMMRSASCLGPFVGSCRLFNWLCSWTTLFWLTMSQVINKVSRAGGQNQYCQTNNLLMFETVKLDWVLEIWWLVSQNFSVLYSVCVCVCVFYSAQWPRITRGAEENQWHAGGHYEEDGCSVQTGQHHRHSQAGWAQLSPGQVQYLC